MVDAATEFKKSGFSDDDAATLARVASEYQNVADEQLSAGEAANFIISQMKAFNMTAADAEHIIDAVNEVSNNTAVSSADLATNIGKASAALAVGNNTYEETLALMTGIVEITRSGTKAARGLVSVQSRLNQIVDDGSSVGKKLTEWYKEHDIAIYDQEGQLRNLYSILTDVAKIWPELTTNEKDYYLNQQAGANQTQNLASALNNFKNVQKAYELAMNSAGSAAKENERYMESLEAKVSALKSTFQDFANNVITKEFLSKLLELAKIFLDFVNTPFGQASTRVALLTTGLTALYNVVKYFGAPFFAPLLNLVKALKGAGSGIATTAGAATKLGSALSGALPVILGVAAALAVGGALWKATEDSRKSIDELNDSIDTDNQKLQTNKERLAEINGMAWNDKTPEILAEKDALEKENAELQAQIEKYQQLKKEKAQDILDNAYGIETTYTTQRVRGKEQLVPTTEIIKGEEYYQKLTDKLREYQSLLDKNHELNDEQLADYQKTASEASRLADAINILNPDIMTATESERQLVYALADAQAAMSSASSYVSNYVDGLYQTGKEAKKTGNALTEYVVDAIIDVNNTDLSTNQKVSALQSIMSQADLTSTELVDKLANAIITVGNTNLDVSGQIANLQALALQAGYTAQAVAAVFGMDENTVSNQVRTSATGYMRSQWAKGNKISSEQAMAWAKKNYASSLWNSLKTSYTPTSPQVVTTGGGGGGGGADAAKKEAKKAVKEVKKDVEDAVDDVSDSISDALNEQKQMMQGVIDYYVEYSSRKIEELQDQIDAINDKYDKMLQDAEDRAQAQLDALEAQNEAVEDQIALQQKLEALDKAKNTMQMVFKDGQFVYQSDADEVSKSQNELNAYYRQKDYENRKKYIEDSLKAEKDYIETSRNNETAALEEEKARWEEYKEGWSNLTSEYEYQQNKLLADQMFGIEQENANWQTRLANLQSFVAQYNSLMGSLSGFGGASGGVSGGNFGGVGNGNLKQWLDTWDLNAEYNPLWDKNEDYGTLLEDAIKKGYGWDWIAGVAGQRNAKIKSLGLEGKVESTQELFDRLIKRYGYYDGYTGEYGTFQGGTGMKPDIMSDMPSASNPFSASSQSDIMRLEDQIERNSAAWFNASPAERERLRDENERLRKELERLNPRGYASGTISARGGISMVGEQGPELRVLNHGDGIIPADITRNLMKIGSDPRWFANRSGAGNTILNVANVSLPSVRNAQQFVDGLKQMAIQRSYAAT